MASVVSSINEHDTSFQTPVILSPESSPFKKRDPHNEANIRNNLCNSTPRSVKRQFSDAFDLSPVQSSKKSNNSFCENNSEIDDNSSLLDGVENGENSARRGRPKLDAIKCLISSASDSKSAIRCHTCNRVFPREKSLQAHIRTHTGERPFVCHFEGCEKRFTQSGQLRTHQRLHTGEKPFVCRFQGCNNRFTHANRRCPLHPQHGVRRDRLSIQLAGHHSKNHRSSKENHSNTKSLKSVNNFNENQNKVNCKQQATSKVQEVQKEVASWLEKQNDKKVNSDVTNSFSNGIKRKLNGRPVRKIKKPKFLDDSSSSSSEEEITNTFNQIQEIIVESKQDNCAQLIWKKKRAALELHAKESSTSSSYVEKVNCSESKHELNIEHNEIVHEEEHENVNQSLNYSLDEVMLTINKSHSSIDGHESSFQDDEIYDDRLVGALALIELSKSRPQLIEYSSEIDMSDANDYTGLEYSVCNDYFASSQGDLNYSDIHYSCNEEYY